MSQSTPEPRRPRARNRNRWFLAGALLVAAAGLAVITVGGIGENLVYYWGPTELAAAGERAIGANVRLGGLVAEGSIRRGGGVSGVEFDVVDRQGGTVHVKSSGVPPQMFRERIGVVVEGTLTNEGYFKGTRLMVSHGNEYRAPGEGESVDVRKAMQTVREEAEAGAP